MVCIALGGAALAQPPQAPAVVLDRSDQSQTASVEHHALIAMDRSRSAAFVTYTLG
jgi:hypothetical protein